MVPDRAASYCGYLFHLAFILPGLWIAFQVTGAKGVPFETALASVTSGQLAVTYGLVLVGTFLSGAGVYSDGGAAVL